MLLLLPDVEPYAVTVPSPGSADVEVNRVLSARLRDVMAESSDRFGVFGPDGTSSNRLSRLFEVTDHELMGELRPTDEAFAHVVDSMFNQLANRISKCKQIPWRRPIPSLTCLRINHDTIDVRGYKVEGSVTTPSTWRSPTTSTASTSSATWPSGCEAGVARSVHEAVAPRRAHRARALHRRDRRGPARRTQLALGRVPSNACSAAAPDLSPRAMACSGREGRDGERSARRPCSEVR